MRRLIAADFREATSIKQTMRDIVEMIANAYTTDEIALTLGLSENTVKERLRSTYRRLEIDKCLNERVALAWWWWNVGKDVPVRPDRDPLNGHNADRPN